MIKWEPSKLDANHWLKENSPSSSFWFNNPLRLYFRLDWAVFEVRRKKGELCLMREKCPDNMFYKRVIPWKQELHQRTENCQIYEFSGRDWLVSGN